MVEGLPWGPWANERFRGRFGLASDVVPEDDLDDSPFFHDYMRPQGLAREWPVCHVICAHGGRPLSGMVIYRREGCRPIDRDDLALLDTLVPHLARAYAVHCQLAEVRHQREALTEVIDRLPTGVVLVDSEGRAVLTNRSAEETLALRDGFRLERGRPSLENDRENRALQALIAKVVSTPAERASSAGGVLSGTRPSGGRPYSVLVGPLRAASPGHTTDEAKAIVFVADPERGHGSTTDALESLYHLTRAEADLVRLIAEGRSLEDVASERGVTINTVRSQLKQVFSKTDTNRQGELVHLVLTGIASLRDESNRYDR